jgi:hypothetical protein
MIVLMRIASILLAESGACHRRTRHRAAVPLHWTIEHDLRLVAVG